MPPILPLFAPLEGEKENPPGEAKKINALLIFEKSSNIRVSKHIYWGYVCYLAWRIQGAITLSFHYKRLQHKKNLGQKPLPHPHRKGYKDDQHLDTSV